MQKAIYCILGNHRKLASKRIMQISQNYYAVCIYCGYSGSDWSASGECPACGEVN